jgi:D-alanyl-D-alanine carboxypeptidase/D-alanyl-D-alanine-endopeptidase (penicillin-binding protein 4)
VRRVPIALLACALAACARHDQGAPPKPAPSATARPSPTAPPTWSRGERARAAAVLGDAFADPVFDGAGIVVLAADGSPLYAHNARVPMTPASTLKLLIAATSLDALGPARRFDTSFVALAPPADGTIEGPLWLVGGGDPLLRSSDMRGGVGALVRAGVQRITGGLVVDATAFSGPEQNPFWDPTDLLEDYAAGTSALSLDGDVVEFRVTPREPGAEARVSVVPRNPRVAFLGSIVSGYATDVHINRVDPPGPQPSAPPDRNAFSVAGTITVGPAQSFYLPVLGIAAYAGGATQAILQDRGVVLEGGVRLGQAPLAAVSLWLHHSLPLAALVREMLVFSDNHTAEQLLRIIGFERAHGGTEGGGVRVERAYLARAGIPLRGLHIVDGSGLSPKDRVPPIVLAMVVAQATRAPWGGQFVRGLPLVGMEGTVRHHDVHAARGRARAKSGHIEWVNALAGTVATRRHGRVSFAFIINGPRADAGVVTRSEDRALDALADF